jgi:hypothetical protein
MIFNLQVVIQLLIVSFTGSATNSSRYISKTRCFVLRELSPVSLKERKKDVVVGLQSFWSIPKVIWKETEFMQIVKRKCCRIKDIGGWRETNCSFCCSLSQWSNSIKAFFTHLQPIKFAVIVACFKVELREGHVQHLRMVCLD